MYKLFIILGILFLISCNSNSPTNNESIAGKNQSQIKIDYKDWKVAKGDNIEFAYPKNWQLKIQKNGEFTRFGLTNDTDTSTPFFPIEIWEVNSQGQSYESFASVPHEYFEKETDGKRADLRNLIPTTFRNFQATKYEFDKEGIPVDIITINAVKKYYMLVNYKDDSVSNHANEIFYSIKISKE